MVKNRENPILESDREKIYIRKVKDIPVQQDLAQKQSQLLLLRSENSP